MEKEEYTKVELETKEENSIYLDVVGKGLPKKYVTQGIERITQLHRSVRSKQSLHFEAAKPEEHTY